MEFESSSIAARAASSSSLSSLSASLQSRLPTAAGEAFTREEDFEEDSPSSRIYHALLHHRMARMPSIPKPAHLTRISESLVSQNISQKSSTRTFFNQGAVPDAMPLPSSSSPLHLDRESSHGGEEVDDRVTSGMPFPTFSPNQIALEFAKSAAHALNSKEVEYLIHFLRKPPRQAQEFPREHVRSKIETFHEDEVAISGEPRDRLAYPSGSEDAELGVILHCQSTKGHVGEFWDPDSRTIQLLIKKGLSPDFIYGFDWHWRAEESMRRHGKTSCPTTRWSTAQRSIHDQFSRELLELLPLPWVLIGGGCAKHSYRRTLSGLSKQLTMELDDAVKLEIDLDFQENSIRRIAIYVPHPSSAFIQPSSAQRVGRNLDTSMNFFLWLQHRDGQPNSFTETMLAISRGVPGAAPFQELYEYRAQERALGRNLTQDEYQPAFLSWAVTYLGEIPLVILGRGDSLAEAIKGKIGQKISTIQKSNGFNAVRTGRKGPVARYGYEYRPTWDGQRVSVTQKGSFKIFLSEDQESLELRGGRPLQRKVSESSGPVTIHFSEEHITLQQDGSVVFRTTCAQIKDPDLRARWIEQVKVESREKGILQN